MAKKPNEESYSPEEARKRFESALRGARIAGPKHRESVTPKRKKAKKAKTTKPGKEAGLRRVSAWRA